MKLEIIMFNMSNWREWEKGVVNRNRHIFFALRKNPNVSRLIAIDFLPFTFKRAVRNYYEGIFNGLEGETIYRDLTNQVKKLKKEEGLAETYVFSSIDSLFSPQRFLDKLIQVLKKINQSGNQSFPTMRVNFYSPWYADISTAGILFRTPLLLQLMLHRSIFFLHPSSTSS